MSAISTTPGVLALQLLLVRSTIDRARAAAAENSAIGSMTAMLLADIATETIWVTQANTRIELQISSWEAERNKAIFDRLFASRAELESSFGASFNWDRLDGNITGKVGVSIPGGWLDEATFPDTAEHALATMKRFHGAVHEAAGAARDATAPA